MTPAERKGKTDKIWQSVRANHQALNNCPGPHDFQKIEKSKPFSDYRCSKCQGKVDFTAYDWYVMGLNHGRGN